MPDIHFGYHAYTPGGKAHRSLARLADGPAGFPQLAEAIGRPVEEMTASTRRKAWRRLDFLVVAELATKHGSTFTLTATGADLLDELNQALGYDLRDRPAGSTVRIFAKAAANA